MITEKKAMYIFDVLWSGMDYVQEHRQNCLNLYPQIEKQFIKHRLDFNALLEELIKYDGIGITIATGLIWKAYPGSAVPFDKWTTTWCVVKKYIRSANISDDYKAISKQIIKELKSRKKPINVEQFVREARVELEDGPLSKSLIFPS